MDSTQPAVERQTNLVVGLAFLPFAGIFVDRLSFDPQTCFSLIGYCVFIAAYLRWVWKRYDEGSLSMACLAIFSAPVVLLIHLVAASIFSLWLSECFTRAVVTVQLKNGDYVFDIGTRGVNGLHRLTVWDADTWETYWRVDMDGYHERRLIYGEVPQSFLIFGGNVCNAQQTFPVRDRPKALPHGKKFVVHVSYQFDVFVSASIGGDEYAFTTDSQGRVINTSWVQPGTYPMEHERSALDKN